MALIFAIIVAIGTVALSLLILFANRSSATSSQHTQLWPTIIIGFGIAAALAFSHYYEFSW